MAGCRALTPIEERKLLRVVRRLPARDQALITCQWFTGFRISEVLSLTVGSVLRDGELVGKIGVSPRNMKGGYGRTRWVPVSPELNRALRRHLGCLRKRWELCADMPLFPSRQGTLDGSFRALTRESARLIMHRALARAGIQNDGQLGTHVFRKTWASRVYQNSDYDILVVSAALNHANVATTQRYLVADQEAVVAAMRGVDFTRGPRRTVTDARIRKQPIPAVHAA